MSKVNYIKTAATLTAFLLVIVPIAIVEAASGGGSVSGGSATIQNPLGTNSVQGLLLKIMDLVVKVGSIIVVFFIIYSGYKFVTARGNESEVTKAKDIFWATIIGGAILLGADVIANVVVNTVKTTTGAR
jgi:hypothetical protein